MKNAKVKKIGIDARILQLPRRGQGQYAYYLIKHLIRMDQAYQYVLFYSGFRKGECVFRAKRNNPHVKEVWNRVPGSILQALWGHSRFPPVEQLIGDVALFHNPFNFNFTYYTPVPSRAPMVVTFNGMADPATIWDHYDPGCIDRWFEVIAREAARIIVVSRSVQEDLLRRVPCDEQKIRLIHYGVADDFRRIDDRATLDRVLERHSLRGKQYMLYVGQAEKNKNLEGLLCAFAEVIRRDGCSGLHLVMVGSIDAAYQRIIGVADDLGIGDRIICTGYIDHQELPCIYSGAQLCVLPSFHEWFGIPLLEAMACGVPVVASRACGIPEVVGEAGILFNPHDTKELVNALHAVLTDTEKAASLREAGLLRIRQFGWDVTAQKTHAVYEEVVGHGV